MLLKTHASFVIDLIHNILLFLTAWPAKAVQNRCIWFYSIRTTGYCNQCLAFMRFSWA